MQQDECLRQSTADCSAALVSDAERAVNFLLRVGGLHWSYFCSWRKRYGCLFTWPQTFAVHPPGRIQSECWPPSRHEWVIWVDRGTKINIRRQGYQHRRVSQSRKRLGYTFAKEQLQTSCSQEISSDISTSLPLVTKAVSRNACSDQLGGRF